MRLNENHIFRDMRCFCLFVCLFVSTDNPSLSYSPSFKDDAKNTGYGCGLSYGGLRQSTESNVGKQEDKERNVQSYITRSVNVVMVAR